jgi:phospholipid/cholesterol/gamma-HCH transport system substrate-binding protein
VTINRQLALGAFFVIVLGILGYFTLFMTDFSLFKEEHTVVVHFPDANGVRQGDEVRVAGIRQGRVKELSYDPAEVSLERRIKVTLKMDAALALRQGFSIAIQDSTLLGGKVIVIDPGPADGVAVASDAPLQGIVARNALAAIGDLVDDNREGLKRIVDGAEEVVENLRTGKGAFGRLFNDEELAQSLKDGVSKFEKAADNIAALTDDMRAGKGTIGRLLNDEELSKKVGDVVDRLTAISTDLQSVSKDLAEGKGTFGRLFKDEKLADDVAKAVESIRGTFDKIQNGEGAMARLINDPALAQDLKDAIAKISKVADDLAVASDSIRNGKGTIGKLVMDDQLYAQIEQALRQITGALEEYREAAPTTAFVSALFSLF